MTGGVVSSHSGALFDLNILRKTPKHLKYVQQGVKIAICCTPQQHGSFEYMATWLHGYMAIIERCVGRVSYSIL